MGDRLGPKYNDQYMGVVHLSRGYVSDFAIYNKTSLNRARIGTTISGHLRFRELNIGMGECVGT